jgi:hypothetical protein
MKDRYMANACCIALGLLSAGLSGCATIASGTTQNLTVVSEKNISGARCELSDKKGGKWYVPSTPATVTVRKGDGPMSVICKKEGYNDTIIMVEEELAGAVFGNIIAGGGIGILVDSVSGAAQHYPDKVTVWMEPAVWFSEQDRANWNKAKEDFYAALEKKAEEPAQTAQN